MSFENAARIDLGRKGPIDAPSPPHSDGRGPSQSMPTINNGPSKSPIAVLPAGGMDSLRQALSRAPAVEPSRSLGSEYEARPQLPGCSMDQSRLSIPSSPSETSFSSPYGPQASQPPAPNPQTPPRGSLDPGRR